MMHFRSLDQYKFRLRPAVRCQFVGIIAIFLLLLIPAGWSHAGATASSWVVAVNGQSPDSRTIANHYVALRNIPSRNVIVLSEIPNSETISHTEFIEKILKPILSEIDARGLSPHVQGIAYSCDIPTRVIFPPASNVPPENAAWFAPIASINSATYFYQSVSANQNIVSLYNNYYCRLPVSQRLQLPIPDDMKSLLKSVSGEENSSNTSESTTADSDGTKNGLSTNQDIAAKPELPSEASEDVVAPRNIELDSGFLEQYVRRFPYQPSAWFQLAIIAANNDENDKAIDCLSKAIETGWSYADLLKNHQAFQKLKPDNRFQTLLLAIDPDPLDWTEPRGFDARLAYTPNGIETIDQKGGNRYLLSVVLAATQTVGNTMDEAIQSLKASVNADYTSPQGTFYFTTTDDVRTKCREGLFDLAIEKLKSAGFAGEKVPTTFPIRKKDVLGVTMGSPTFSWIASGSKLIPGAIAENLTSLNGKLDGPGQTKLTEFIANGAAGSSGAVEEPYSLQQKFPLPFIHETYARGATLAEAYYQNLLGPYQLLIVGDPLCQPWSKAPSIELAGLQDSLPITKSTSIKFSAKSNGDDSAPISLLVLADGIVKSAAKQSFGLNLDPTKQKLVGYQELRVIAQEDTPIRPRREKVVELMFGSTADQLEWSLPATQVESSASNAVVIQLSKTWDIDIAIQHNYETLATVPAGDISLTLDLSKLGKGPVRLQAIAKSSDRVIKSRIQYVEIK